MDTILDRVCWDHPTCPASFPWFSLIFRGVGVCVCVSVRGILEYGWPQLMFARMYVCVHGALSLVHSSILVAASKHHVEHGTYSVLRPAGIAGGDVK
jgi:hypothetical protein